MEEDVTKIYISFRGEEIHLKTSKCDVKILITFQKVIANERYFSNA